MGIKFGTFVPQGWRMDLVEIRDPVEQYDAMTRVGYAFVGTAAQLTERIQQLIDVGVNYVITYFPRVAYGHTMLDRFATEVMPQFK